GPSGCGKSTLLKLVAGLVTPTRGVVRIRGAEVREPFPDVGIVFQSAVLLPWRTVLDNVLFSIEMLGLRADSYRDRALSLIELAVQLPRPRTVEMEFDARFKEHSDEIRRLIFARRQEPAHARRA